MRGRSHKTSARTRLRIRKAKDTSADGRGLSRRTLFAASTAPVVLASGILATAQVLILTSLPWTQTALFGDTNPAIWLALGLLIPIAVISVALFRTYAHQVDASAQPAGTKIGPYLLLEEIGRGGMGTVFRAEHALMKRQCAIKLISPERAAQTDMQKRFRQEARATAQLTHWNTIEVYDYGTSEDGRFYYVMELLEGVNLHQYVDRFGPMQPQRVIYLLKQLCNALYEAESHDLVHRDIKPSNIFLTQRGESCDVIKLLDFGLVQTSTKAAVRHGKSDKKLHGSPAFMCPEQARGLNPDHRGDLYSLGAVAYFLLSGHPPFRDENPIMQVVAHATDCVPDFHTIGVSVAKELAAIVLKCLQKDPNDRYQSARSLLIALERCSVPGKWNWQKAEKWWRQYQPVGYDRTGTETMDLDQTTCVDSNAGDSNAGDSNAVGSVAIAGGQVCPSDTPTEIGMLPEDLA
ncbi:MAG: serine/threonine-protein kinase [Fuerstiella sp.]